MPKSYPTILRCYVRPDGDHYLAVCLEVFVQPIALQPRLVVE